MHTLYESIDVKPIGFSRFFLRMCYHFLCGFVLIVVSLLLGMMGYSYFEHMSATDSFLNASMLLAGMGPVKTEGLTEGGKLFAGFYALYSGFTLTISFGIIIVPVIHRVLHLFHVNSKE